MPHALQAREPQDAGPPDDKAPVRRAADPPVVVVIAAYQEARQIAGVVRGLIEHGYPVVVVDDASRDDTAALAAAAGARVLRHAVNLGQGAALRTGFRYLLATHRDAIAVTFDADGQHAASDVAALVAPLLDDTADVALGSRFLRADTTAHVPRARRLLLRAAVRLVRLTTGLALTDAHNGLRALRLSAIRRMELRQDRMAHASELLAEIARLGLRMVEVPVTITYSDYSRAKGQRALDSVSVLWDLTISRLR